MATYTGRKVPAGEIAAALRAAGFPSTSIVIMTAVSLHESGGGYLHARGDAGERGLFQIHPVHGAVFEQAKSDDPVVQARAAKYVWDRQGIRAWSSYKNDGYLKYYQEAQAGQWGYTGVASDVATVAGLDDPTGPIRELVAWLTDPAMWVRVAQVAGGAILALAGLVVLSRDLISPPFAKGIKAAKGLPGPVKRLASTAPDIVDKAGRVSKVKVIR